MTQPQPLVQQDPEEEDDSSEDEILAVAGSKPGRTRKVPAQTFKKEQTKLLQKWFLENIEHPYLKKDDKIQLSLETGLTKK